jgi:hypothetical protein
MKIDFYTSNEQLAPTVANYLFSDEYACIINGQYIENNDKGYQVVGQRLPDNKDEALAVFIYPVNRQPMEVNV